MKSPTPYSSLSNPMCFSGKLPEHNHKVKKPSVHSLLFRPDFQSYKSKPLLIPIPLRKKKIANKTRSSSVSLSPPKLI